jgi:cellulose synthase/poly-beta-1,6-N-acetylglucosamine synthase-like glycosyltransferase
MIFFLGLTLLFLSIIISIPILVLFAECIAALSPAKSVALTALTERPQVAVLVPAHNEALGVGATLATIQPQLQADDRLVVIADNCTDNTAAIARSLGAIVLERQDTEHKGKGYALDYGLQSLTANPPDVVIVIDADTEVHPHSIDRIANLVKSSGRPVQATNLLNAPPQSHPKTAISVFAMIVKNLVRNQGLTRLGFPCHLQGTGMAFPWSLVDRVSFATGNIVEDMKLGLDFATMGYPPIFCAEAKVTGEFPQQETGAKSQKTRWEHGHLQTLITQVPKLFAASFRQRRLDLSVLALDLSVPPLSLLVILWLMALFTTAIGGWLGLTWLPAQILTIAGLLLLSAIGIAWANFAEQEVPFRTLVTLPIYLLWKIPIYLNFVLHPQTEWVRTQRN